MERSMSVNMEKMGTSERLKARVSVNSSSRTPEIKNKWLYLGIPATLIAFAEILVYSGKLFDAAVIHAVVLLGLSFSTVFIKNEEIQKTYQALILLPILRLINLSMPVFFETEFDSFIFIYGIMAIPVSIAASHQELTRAQLGITFKNLFFYIPFSILLGMILGTGEYLITMGTGTSIPDFSIFSLLKLSIVMLFFAGLVEELIFRSILQTRLEILLGGKMGLIITSILFGFMHLGSGSIIEVLYAILVGLVIGSLFYRTRSLPLIAMIHGFMNIFLLGVIPLLLL